MKEFPYVDFNQGLDARLFTPWYLDQISKLSKVKIRFALDSDGYRKYVSDAIQLAKKNGIKDFGVYVLIGYKESVEEAIDRLEFIRSLGVWPNPMRFQPLDAKIKNSYIPPGWTSKELSSMSRYYSRLAWLDGISYEQYKDREEQFVPLLDI